METAIRIGDASPWVLIPILLFSVLILYFLIKFFSVLFDFIQAKGCLTVGLIALVGLPGIVVLSLISGSTIAATLLIIFAVVGVITGYIARDSEGNVGKFGLFIMIVSAITLITALLIKLILVIF
ncbi:MAG: hypothetical protein Q7U54_18935 [Bacteroidales bacterium]|nr:hypothetical protein [Bacteroidales bacterium]